MGKRLAGGTGGCFPIEQQSAIRKSPKFPYQHDVWTSDEHNWEWHRDQRNWWWPLDPTLRDRSFLELQFLSCAMRERRIRLDVLIVYAALSSCATFRRPFGTQSQKSETFSCILNLSYFVLTPSRAPRHCRAS